MNSRTALFATFPAALLVAGVCLGFQEKSGAQGAPAEAGMRTDVMPPIPKPTKEHEWLKGFVGSWDCTSHSEELGESKATETVKAFSDFTILSEYHGDMGGQPFTGMGFLTYDPNKQKYVGTWCDSTMPGIMVYEGTTDAGGHKLTATGMGCNMAGAVVDHTLTYEVKGPDERVFTIYETAKGPNDPSVMKIEYKRHK
jgi:hypothetical protein